MPMLDLITMALLAGGVACLIVALREMTRSHNAAPARVALRTARRPPR